MYPDCSPFDLKSLPLDQQSYVQQVSAPQDSDNDPIQQLMNLIDEGDWCGLLFVAIVLAYVGDAMVRKRPTMKQWGVRLATATFLLVSILRAIENGAPETSDLVAAILRGAMAAALVIGPSWMALSCADVAFRRIVNLRDDVRMRVTCLRDRLRRTREATQRERLERQRAVIDPVDQRRSTDERKRRTDARAKAQRAFHLLRADLRDRFTEKEFTAYVNAYLGDHQSPEDVEYHATKLTQLLNRIAEGTGNSLQPYGVLNQRFEQQKAAIAAAPIDDELRDILLHELDEQYEDEFRRLIREKPQ